MFLLDTNVVSEARKGQRADPGVLAFRRQILHQEDYLPVQVAGELRRGVENLRARGDHRQATLVEKWLEALMLQYHERILPFDIEAAQIWGKLLARNNQNQIDKQLAAIALLYDLTLVTRNTRHFMGTGVRLLNPFRGTTA